MTLFYIVRIHAERPRVTLRLRAALYLRQQLLEKYVKVPVMF